MKVMAERVDLNPRRARTLAGFQDRCIQPLCHLSAGTGLEILASAVNRNCSKDCSICQKALRAGANSFTRSFSKTVLRGNFRPAA